MKTHFSIFLAFVTGFLLPFSTLCAQQKDFQLRASAGVEAELVNRLRLIVGEEVRLKENATQMDKQINNIGISYRFNKFIKADVYYRFEKKWKHPDVQYWKQGTYADLNVRYNAGRLEMGYRFRFQSAHVDMYENQNMLGQWVTRHRVSLRYNIPKSPLTPFVEEELFYGRQYGIYGLSDYRTWIGLRYDAGKLHEFTIQYGIDQEKGVADPLSAYILEFSYDLTLKR